MLAKQVAYIVADSPMICATFPVFDAAPLQNDRSDPQPAPAMSAVPQGLFLRQCGCHARAGCPRAKGLARRRVW